MSETAVGMDMYVRAEPRNQKDVLIAGEIRVALVEYSVSEMAVGMDMFVVFVSLTARPHSCASGAAEIGHISPSPRHRSNQRADSPLCDARHERCHEGNIKVAVRWKIDIQGNGTIGPVDLPRELKGL